MVETKSDLRGSFYVLRTIVGKFEIPKSIVKKGLLQNMLSGIGFAIRKRYAVNEFKQLIINRYVVDEAEWYDIT